MTSSDMVFVIAGAVTLAVWVGAGIVCKTWRKAVGIAVAWTLSLGLVFSYIAASAGSDRQIVESLARSLVVEALAYLLPAAAVVAAVTSLVSNFIRRHRTQQDKA